MSETAESNGHDAADSDANPEGPDAERPTKEQSAIGRVGAWLFTTVPKPLLGIRETLFKRMAVKSLENYHKIAGGDAIAINAQPGQQVDFEPVLYRTPEELDEGERPGWKVKGRDKVWNPGAEGNTVNYLGRTPTVLLEDDDHVEAGWLAPRIGAAIELDNYWPLFTNPQFNAVFNVGTQQATPQAVADGGHELDIQQDLDAWAQRHLADIRIDTPGVWKDNIIDLNSGEGYDGMRVSTEKAREWRAESASSEEMQMQQDRGWLMGQLGEDAPGTFKILLLTFGFIAAVLLIIFVLPKVIGGGGGGGGGINPLMVAGALMGV